MEEAAQRHCRTTMDGNPSVDHDLSDNQLGISWMEAAISTRLARTSSAKNPCDELMGYLNSPLEKVMDDAVAWWGVSGLFLFRSLRLTSCFNQRNNQSYPVLSLMAKDYLAIPGSSSVSERLFSSEGRIVTTRRASMSTTTIECLQIL
jgi:hypothetical protein